MKQKCYTKVELARLIDLINYENGIETYFEVYQNYYTKEELETYLKVTIKCIANTCTTK